MHMSVEHFDLIKSFFFVLLLLKAHRQKSKNDIMALFVYFVDLAGCLNTSRGILLFYRSNLDDFLAEISLR